MAAEAVLLVPTDPRSGARLADAALALARRDRDRRAASTAERALGLAARATHDVDGAVDHLRRAVRLAEGDGHVDLAAQARVTLAGTLGLRGQWGRALAQLEAAAPFLSGVELAVLEAQRSFLLILQGRFADAARGLEAVLPTFKDAGDHLLEARVLANLGLCHAYLGALGPAEAHLTAAQALHLRLGHEHEAADARQNLGWVTARMGDIPAALAWFDRADECFRSLGVVDAEGLQDRCEALLSARLVDEAREAGERAVTELAARGLGVRLAEARLLVAEAALLQGDLTAAAVEAERARRAFVRQRRPGFVALARHLALRVATAAEPPTPALLATARRTARALEDAGWAVPALDARLVAVQLAIHLGRTKAAADELRLARRARRHGPVELRTRAWHAEALLRLAAGDRHSAEAALRAGLRIVEAHRAALGATELRASASAHGVGLAGLGLRMAVEEGSATRALAWAERWRVGSLWLRPARPPDDPLLAADMAALRQVVGDADRAVQAGRPTARILSRQATLERTIRDRSRHLVGVSRYGPPRRPAPGELRRALGARALVELVEVDGQLHAVVIAGRPPSLHALGPVSAVAAEAEAVRYAIRRLAFGRGTPASLEAASVALAHGAQRLDRLLLAPLAGQLGDRPVVISPSATTHGVPWSVLPSRAARAVSVVPSAALWWRSAEGKAGGPPEDDEANRGVCLIAGPGLGHAEAEVAELAALRAGAHCLTGEAATVSSALDAIDGAGLAHVAAHGRFRTDNPLFSCLTLADGPLTVYDLEGLCRAPRVLILSACDSGVSGIRAGDELIGLAAALFSLGTTTLVASLVPVSDAATRRLMVGLHRGLLTGSSPAEALAQAQADLARGGGPEETAAAAAFVCLGFG